MTIISAQNKYFPPESLAYWDKRHIFSGLWEEVETGGYLPLVVTEKGENLGTDGDIEEVMVAAGTARAYMVSGCPQANYIGCRETERSVFLYWKDSEGTYYEDMVGVMEMYRWASEVRDRRMRARQNRAKK